MLGSIGKAKIGGYALCMSVTVGPLNAKQLQLRINARFRETVTPD
jgi:hypothetical protein